MYLQLLIQVVLVVRKGDRPKVGVHTTCLVQPQSTNEVTPGMRHLRIKKPTHLIHHNRPSNNASAASYKLGEACIILGYSDRGVV